MSSFVGEDMMPKRLAIYNCSTRAAWRLRKMIRFGLRCTAYLCSKYRYSRSTMSGSEEVQRRVSVLDDKSDIQSKRPVEARPNLDSPIYICKMHIGYGRESH